MKKLLAVVLCLVLCMGVLALSVFAEDYYVVAGDQGLCGTNWDPSNAANAMTKSGDLYTKTFSNVQPGNYGFKVTNGSWDQCWPGQNFDITVSTACDVTITFNPATSEIKVSGSGVAIAGEPVIEVMRIVGSGIDDLGNWDPANSPAVMTKTADRLYEYTFAGLENVSLMFKFVANGGWSYNFGGAYGGSGVVTDAWWNSGTNIEVSVTEKSDVKVELDLRAFDYSTKNGAKFTVTVTAVGSGNPGTSDPVTPPAEENEITVHAKVPEGWTNVGAYIWDGGNNNAWPGAAMTLGEDGWYTVKVPGWAKNVIINGDGVQTNDIAIESGKDIWVVVEAAENGFVGTVAYEAPKTGESVTVAAAAALALLAGTALVTTVSAKKKFF